MFLEPDFLSLGKDANIGWVEVICGSMFSGKTEELIRRVNRALIAKQQVVIFKPTIDNRYDETKVVSHNSNAIQSIPVTNAEEILKLLPDCQLVGIDEAQFFDDSLIDVVETLANRGFRVVIAGLDMDYKGIPFGVMPKLMAIAEFVTKVHAICVECGGIASYSFRTIDSEEKVLLGETNMYEARCRRCFVSGMKEVETIH